MGLDLGLGLKVQLGLVGSHHKCGHVCNTLDGSYNVNLVEDGGGGLVVFWPGCERPEQCWFSAIMDLAENEEWW